MAIQGFVFFGLTLTIQSKFWRWKGGESKGEEVEDEDIDVAAEKTRVLNSEVGDDVLQVKSLFKRYKGKGGKPAVNDLTFGVHKRECFGFLGTLSFLQSVLFYFIISPHFGPERCRQDDHVQNANWRHGCDGW